MGDDRIKSWVETYVDRIWGERIDHLTMGTHMSPSELYAVMRGVRDDMALSLAQQSLCKDPAELKAGILAFRSLDEWLTENGGKTSVRAAPVSQADINRIEKIRIAARGIDA